MKKMLLFFTCSLIFLSIASAQWHNKKDNITGNGIVKKESRQVADFDAITVSGGIDLYIKQTGKTSVEIEADENLLPEIVTEVNGSTLKIYMKTGYYKVKKLAVYVTVDDLKKVTASGGSDVYSTGTLKAANLELIGSGGSDLELTIEADYLDCSVSGGSDVELEGSANKCNLSASGGSDVKAYDLKTNKCSVTASGGSDAYVTVNEEIDLKASGGSDVYYKGNAKVTSKSVSGSSDVHHAH